MSDGIRRQCSPLQPANFPLVSLLEKSADARSASGRFSRALVEGDTAWSGGATVPPDASTCGAIFNGLIGRHFVIGIAEQQFSACDPGHRSEITCPNAVALATGPELTGPTGQRRAINKRRFRKRWSDITGEAAPSPRNLRQRLKPLYHQGRVGDRHREVSAWS